MLIFLLTSYEVPSNGVSPVVWHNITNDQLEGTSTICMTEGASGAILVGTPFGAYRSSDKGQSWTRGNTGLGSLNILSMASSRGVVYAATKNAVYRTLNNGDSWTNVTGSITPSDVSFLYAHKDGRLFAGSLGALHVSSDSGNTWKPYARNIPHQDSEKVKERGTIAFGRNNKIIASIGTGDYQSTDNGLTWQRLNDVSSHNLIASDSSNFVVFGRNVYRDLSTGFVNTSMINSFFGYHIVASLVREGMSIPGPYSLTNAFVVLSDSTIINSAYDLGLRTTIFDSLGGQQSSFTHKGLQYQFISCMMKHSDGSIYAGTAGGGIYRSTDLGKTWIGSSRGLSDPYVYYCYFDAIKKRIFVVTGSGMYNTTDDGTSWIRCSDGLDDYFVFKIVQSSKGDLYALTWHGLYKSRIDVLKWNKVSVFNGTSEVQEFNDIAIGANDSLVVATISDGMYLSVNSGGTWSPIHNADSLNLKIYSESIYYNKITKRWCKGNTNTYWSSANGMKNWNNTELGNMQAIPTREFIQDADNKLYCISSVGITGINDQLTPVKVDNLTGNTPQTVYHLQTNALSQLFSVNNKGVYRMWKPDGNWAVYGDSLPTVGATALVADTSGFLFAGTSGHGVYKTNRNTLDIYPPQLLTPAYDSSDVSDSRVIFNWDTAVSARQFHFQLSTTNDMQSLIVNDSSLKKQTIVLNKLRRNREYSWRVRSIHKNFLSDWSPVWKFRTVTAVPAKLSLLLPPNNAKDVLFKPTLHWISDDNAERYELEFGDSLMQSVVFRDSAVVDTLIDIPTLHAATKYFWHVRAIGKLGVGEWSDIWSFTTSTDVFVSGNNESNEIRIQPQPASDVLVLSGLHSDRFVFTIYDALGRAVIRKSEATIDVKGLSRGIYFFDYISRGTHCTGTLAIVR